MTHPILQPLLALRRRPALRKEASTAASLAGLRVGRSLQQSPMRARFGGSLAGRAVEVKWILGQGAAEATRAEAENLAALGDRMRTGPLRLPGAVEHVPELGIGVTERVMGQHLASRLRAVGAPERAARVTQAGAWLATYTQGRRRRTEIGAPYWLAQYRALADRPHASEDRSLARTIGLVLTALREEAAGRTVTQAVLHGDFTAERLLCDGATLWGTDPEGTAWWPLSKDAARFLVHLTVLCPANGGPHRAGIAADDLAALDASALLRAEPPAVTSFFTGFEIGRRLAFPRTPATLRRRTRALARAWISAHPAP